jgi:uncharacterized membrane protein
MAHAEAHITIDRPVSTVFDFVLDGRNGPLWRPSVADVELVSGTPSGVGAVYRQGLKGPGGRRIAGDYQITACTPNEGITFQVIAGPARPTGTYRFEGEGSRTRVTFSLHYEPKGLSRLMDPVITRTMQGEVALLANLKVYLENQPA